MNTEAIEECLAFAAQSPAVGRAREQLAALIEAAGQVGPLRAALADCLPFLGGHQCDGMTEGDALTALEGRIDALLAGAGPGAAGARDDPRGYRAARGAAPWQPGMPTAGGAIRRVRDGGDDRREVQIGAATFERTGDGSVVARLPDRAATMHRDDEHVGVLLAEVERLRVGAAGARDEAAGLSAALDGALATWEWVRDEGVGVGVPLGLLRRLRRSLDAPRAGGADS